jgi:hypothetical protein
MHMPSAANVGAAMITHLRVELALFGSRESLGVLFGNYLFDQIGP